MKLFETFQQNYKQMPMRSKTAYVLGVICGAFASIFALLSLLNGNQKIFPSMMYILASMTWSLLGLSDLWNPHRKDILVAVLSFCVSGINLVVSLVTLATTIAAK